MVNPMSPANHHSGKPTACDWSEVSPPSLRGSAMLGFCVGTVANEERRGLRTGACQFYITSQT